MNGWRFAGTVSSAVGDVFGLQLESAVVGFHVAAAGRVELVLNDQNDPFAGGPAVTVATGGNLDVAVQLDCDRPAAAPDCTLEYYIGGQAVGTRTARQTGVSPDLALSFPLFWPGGMGNNSAFAGRCGRFYRRAGMSTSGEQLTRWDNDAASVLNGYAAAGAIELTAPFAIRPPVGGPPATHPCGAQLIARLVQSGEAETFDVGLFRRLQPGDDWSLVLTLSDWQSVTAGGARWADPSVLCDGRSMLFIDSLKTEDLGDHVASALPAHLERWYARALVPGDETASAGDTLPFTSASPIGADRQQLVAVPHWRDGLEQIYAVPGLPQAPKPRLIVAGGLRNAGNHASRPRPFLDRRPDGRFELGTFVNGRFRSWTSDNGSGDSWTANRDDAIGADADLVGACWLRGTAGVQAAAGYDVAGERFRLFWRRNHDAAWEGPITIVAGQPLAAAPYLSQQPSGLWECGWYLAGAWQRYLSADLQTWTEAV